MVVGGRFEVTEWHSLHADEEKELTWHSYGVRTSRGTRAIKISLRSEKLISPA